jgi:hypothetical protein
MWAFHRPCLLQYCQCQLEIRSATSDGHLRVRVPLNTGSRVTRLPPAGRSLPKCRAGFLAAVSLEIAPASAAVTSIPVGRS